MASRLFSAIGLAGFLLVAVVLELLILATGIAVLLVGVVIAYGCVTERAWLILPLSLIPITFGVAIARTAFENDDD